MDDHLIFKICFLIYKAFQCITDVFFMVVCQAVRRHHYLKRHFTSIGSVNMPPFVIFYNITHIHSGFNHRAECRFLLPAAPSLSAAGMVY